MSSPRHAVHRAPRDSPVRPSLSPSIPPRATGRCRAKPGTQGSWSARGRGRPALPGDVADILSIISEIPSPGAPSPKPQHHSPKFPKFPSRPASCLSFHISENPAFTTFRVPRSSIRLPRSLHLVSSVRKLTPQNLPNPRFSASKPCISSHLSENHPPLLPKFRNSTPSAVSRLQPSQCGAPLSLSPFLRPAPLVPLFPKFRPWRPSLSKTFPFPFQNFRNSPAPRSTVPTSGLRAPASSFIGPKILRHGFPLFSKFPAFRLPRSEQPGSPPRKLWQYKAPLRRHLLSP